MKVRAQGDLNKAETKLKKISGNIFLKITVGLVGFLGIQANVLADTQDSRGETNVVQVKKISEQKDDPKSQKKVDASSCAAQKKGDLAESLKKLREVLGDQLGSWVEFAPTVDGKIDSSKLVRFSFLQGKTPDSLVMEFWMDRLGEAAMRVEQTDDGKVVNLVKFGKLVLLSPEQKKGEEGEKDEKSSERERLIAQASCELQRILSEKMQKSVAASQKKVKVETVAGTFQCTVGKLNVPGGKEIAIYASDEAPVRKVVKFVLPDGNALELVAAGKGAYSSFPVGVEPIALEGVLDFLKDFSAEMKQAEEKAQERNSMNAAALQGTDEQQNQKAGTQKNNNGNNINQKKDGALPEGQLYRDETSEMEGLKIQVQSVSKNAPALKQGNAAQGN